MAGEKYLSAGEKANPDCGWLSTLNGAPISTELIKKGDLHSGSDHPQGILTLSFHTAPL